jgi:hypothetical protein
VTQNASEVRELARRYPRGGRPDLWALDRGCPAVPQCGAQGLVAPNGPGRTAGSGRGGDVPRGCGIERGAASVARGASDITVRVAR